MESAAERAATLAGSLPEAVAAVAELDRRCAELRKQAEAAYVAGDVTAGDKVAAELAITEAQRAPAEFRASILAEAARRVAAEVRAEELRGEIEAAEKHAETVAGDARELAAQVRPTVMLAREAVRRAVNAEKAANFAHAELARLRAAAEGRELHREPGVQYTVMANMTGKSALLTDLMHSGDGDF